MTRTLISLGILCAFTFPKTGLAQSQFEPAAGDSRGASAAIHYLLSQQRPTDVHDMGLVLGALTREGNWVDGSPQNIAGHAAQQLADFLTVAQKPDGHWAGSWNPATGEELIDDRQIGDQAWVVAALAAYANKADQASARNAVDRGSSWLAAQIDSMGKVGGSTASNAYVWWAMQATSRFSDADRIKNELLNVSTVVAPDDAPNLFEYEAIAQYVAARGKNSRALLDLLLSQQRPDGSMPAYPEGPATVSSTAWLYYAITGSPLRDEPQSQKAQTQGGIKASLNFPANGSTLAGSTATFQWNEGQNVLEYYLYIGNTPSLGDLYAASAGTNTSLTATGLPTDGRPLYVRLLSKIDTTWQYNDYIMYAAGGANVKAALTSPANGSKLAGSTTTFEWGGGQGVVEYYLYIGNNSPALGDIYTSSAGTATSLTVNGLPTDGRKLFVRLYSKLQTNAWLYNDYTLFAYGGFKATLTSPANGSTLTGSTATFQWNGGQGVSEYYLYIGNTPSLGDVYSASAATNTSLIATGLPTDGRQLYVRLFSKIDATWQFNDHTMFAANSAYVKAVLNSPLNGSKLTSSTTTFEWSVGQGVVEYYLYIGNAAGLGDIYMASSGTGTSLTVNGLPTDGRKLAVRLFSKLQSNAWQYNDYILFAFGGIKATLYAPVIGSTLAGSTDLFRWTQGQAVTEYYLNIGNTPGAGDVFAATAGTSLSRVVSGLPTDGRQLYVRLLSRIDGNFQYNDYTMFAFNDAYTKAVLTSPVNGSKLTSSTTLFEWGAGQGVVEYYLYVGNAPGLGDIYMASSGTGTSLTVSGLPTDGRKLSVRLFSKLQGVWQYNDYTLFAPGGIKASLTSPLNGSTLAGSTATFQWDAGLGVSEYYLYIGNIPGLGDLFASSTGTNTSRTVTGLPADGRQLYMRLFSKIETTWQYNDYIFAAAGGSAQPVSDRGPRQ